MMMPHQAVFTLFILVPLTTVQSTTLQGSKVFNVYPKNKQDLKLINDLITKISGLDIWQNPYLHKREARILVTREKLEAFKQFLKYSDIQYKVFIDDPERVFKNEIKLNEKAKTPKENGDIDFNSYHRHSEINEYLDRLARDYPQKVKVKTAGKTPNGRELKFIRISATKWQDPNVPVIVINGGIHAREWISPAFTLYMTKKLVENVTEDDVAEKANWIIIPVLNPDGYEYTHTVNRMWRKTRSHTSNPLCPGVDGNRNFDFHWMESGASDQPCSETFAGEKAFSETETQVLRDVLARNKGRAKGYLDIHSYGSYILYPWGYDAVDPPNGQELDELGKRMAKAIEEQQEPDSQKYVVGNSAKTLYPAAGATDDYAMGVGNATLAYTIELPGGGTTGFDLPPSKIKQVVTETWAGLLVFARYIIEKYN